MCYIIKRFRKIMKCVTMDFHDLFSFETLQLEALSLFSPPMNLRSIQSSLKMIYSL